MRVLYEGVVPLSRETWGYEGVVPLSRETCGAGRYEGVVPLSRETWGCCTFEQGDVGV